MAISKNIWKKENLFFFSEPIHILNLIFYVKSDIFSKKTPHFKTGKQMMMMMMTIIIIITIMK